MDVAVYTRVSTKHEEQFSSLKNQEKHYKEYCNKKKYNLVELYSDEGLSATSPNRKEYLQMINDAGLDYVKDESSNEILYFKDTDRKPKFQKIITKDVSRFARNTDAIVLIRKLRNKGVYVLFENADFSTEDSDWELRLNLLLTFSQQESIDRSKKVAFAYKQRSKDGVYHMTRNLYGYRYDKDTKETTVFDEEAKVVRKMFDLYVNHGYGVKNIVNYLNENEIKTSNDKTWSTGTVRRLLRNEKYIGRVILNRYTNNGVTSRKTKIERPEEEWVILEDAIPTIIDMDTWNKAQEIMQIRVGQTKEGSLTGSRKVKNIFYHKLFCGKCGSPFVRVTATKKRKDGTYVQHNYMCANRRHRNMCDNTMKSHKILERKVFEFAKNELPDILIQKREMYSKIANMQQSLKTMELKMSDKTINKIKTEILDIDDRIEKFTDALLDSDPTVISVVKRKIKMLEEQRIELNERVLEQSGVTLEREIQELEDYKKKLSNMVKKEYSFDDALKFIGSILINEDDISFKVITDEKLEPRLNLDKQKIKEYESAMHFDKLISSSQDILDSLKKLNNR